MARFNVENGFEADCDVIYGDTDSVMVDFRVWFPSKLQYDATLMCVHDVPRCRSWDVGTTMLHNL